MFRMFTAAAGFACLIAAAAAPAHAALIGNALGHNGLNVNALTATGSPIDQLNGVAVERVTLPPGAGEKVAFEPNDAFEPN